MGIMAELKGKLEGYKTATGARYIDAEDPLTASIFESIEVMDRDLVLGAVLLEATGDKFTPEELARAEFFYWMRDVEAFGDLTEPDVMIRIGDTLYLFEAKYLSGLGGESKDAPKQLEREWKGGMALKDKWKLSHFRLVCVLGDASTLEDISRFEDETAHQVHRLKWQDIHRIMADLLESGDIDSRDRILATRCKALLERRKMASFRGFRHLDDYKRANEFYQEVFVFANALLDRLEEKGIIRAIREFRIERDGGQRSLTVGGLEQWAPSYFALAVQKAEEGCEEVRTVGGRATRFYKVDRFAFFMVDVDTARVAVAKMTAPSDTWKPARFWDLFFRSFKKSWTEKMEAITIGQIEFGLELRVLKADAPDLLETVLDILVRYLG
jgi:hypothetical protein